MHITSTALSAEMLYLSMQSYSMMTAYFGIDQSVVWWIQVQLLLPKPKQIQYIVIHLNIYSC